VSPTVEVAINKAWTAVSFRQDTMTLDRSSQPGQPAAPIRHFSRVTVMGGGIRRGGAPPLSRVPL